MKKTAGIHHISAIVGHPQEVVDFYAGILGLRLVKKTINFDDPGTYHLYFGNDGGKPGTIITFFPWIGAYQGQIGGGQVGVTNYAIPVGAMPFWENRLEKFKIAFKKSERFGETYLQFEDFHGLQVELVERAEGQQNNWTLGDVTPDVAIKGFAGAILLSTRPEQTMETLKGILGLEKVGEEGDFIRFKSYGDIGNTIDVKKTALRLGRMGVGVVHHIAWRAKDNQEQLNWQSLVHENGYGVTEVKDRNYFNAIYFREHGKILFEIATDPPGFAVDEELDELGTHLMLPSWYESRRKEFEEILPTIINVK